MKSGVAKGVRTLTLLALVATLAGCGLPRSGPNKRELYASSVQKQGNAFVVTVNDRVIQATSVVPITEFGPSFQNAGRIGSDTIRAGDVLGLTIWENVDDGLLTGPGQSATQLSEIQVDSTGNIFIPYAGRIKAAGNTPEQLREIITRKLDGQTPDPQVQVQRLAGDGSSVTIVGGVGAQGVYPIELSTRTLTSMLAKAGGISIEPDVAQITVVRGSQKGTVWLQDLYQNPRFDIALRPGDRILVEEDTRSFTALGATGAQTRVPFQSQKLSALEAIAQVGGLSSGLADPKGVFVLRDEPAELANSVLGRSDLAGMQRFVYVLDLTEPNGMFSARDFLIRDGDTVYVTEAPFVQWSKTLTALTSPLNSANSINQIAGN
jgi:polysaccharide export outer membrane protein